MSILTNRGAASDSAFASAAPSDVFNGVVTIFRKAMAARRQRLQLLALDDRMLADIGISRADAYRESSRSTFDVPHNVLGRR